MPPAPLPANEPARLDLLRSYAVLDTSRDLAFDRLVFVAAQLLNVPIALITLVDDDRQWFKAQVGTTLHETARSAAFCGYTILSDEVLVVQDATRDERFADNPLVVEQPGIRFYAGAPLIASNGLRLGSLCVIDRQPRGVSPEQMRHLSRLASKAMQIIEMRRPPLTGDCQPAMLLTRV